MWELVSDLQTGMVFTPIPCMVVLFICCLLLCAQVWQACPSQFPLVPSTQTATTTTVPPLETYAPTLPLSLPWTPCSIPPSLPTNCRAVKAHYPAPIIIWYCPEMYHCVSSLHVGVMRFVLMFLYFCQQTVCEFFNRGFSIIIFCEGLYLPSIAGLTGVPVTYS